MAKQYNLWTGFLEDTAAKKKKKKPTIDKAIRNCDKIEFDPQDIRYIKKAIGSLKVANSLLGMINEKNS